MKKTITFSPVYTLKDLKKKAQLYYFPNSGIGRTKANAEMVLSICNYTGRLTDTIGPEVMVSVIADLDRIKDSINRLRETDAFIRNRFVIEKFK